MGIQREYGGNMVETQWGSYNALLLKISKKTETPIHVYKIFQ